MGSVSTVAGAMIAASWRGAMGAMGAKTTFDLKFTAFSWETEIKPARIEHR